jgi:protein-disulfide isomerase
MPSGKKAKQQRRAAAARGARTPPPVRSKGVGGPRSRQASPRGLATAGGVVAVAVIAIVLGIVLTRGGNKAAPLPGEFPTVGSAHSKVALQGAPDANALFKGIPQKGLVLGKPSAPVEMEMFVDVQCPVCQFYEVNYLPTIVQKYIRTGKAQLHLQPWAFIGGAGSQSFSGRLGLIAASFQNKGFEYAKVLYDNQGTEDSGWLTDTVMKTIAASVNGLNLHQWSTDTSGSRAGAIAHGVDVLASSDQIAGTPTVLVGRTGATLRNVLTPQQQSKNDVPTLQETEQAFNAALWGT